MIPLSWLVFCPQSQDRLIFVRAMIKPGASYDLPRPAISPADATRRIRGHIRSVAA